MSRKTSGDTWVSVDTLGPARALVRQDCYVDGAWVGGPDRIDVEDPATGDVIARIPDLSDAQVDAALSAAARAFPAWKARPASERAACLTRLAARMREVENALALLITAENGKPVSDALGEVRYATSFIDWFAGEALRVYGETIPAPGPEQRIVVTREPVGPCALITPWNFPAAMLTRKLGAALAVGCTVVAKPAEATPLTALALAQLAADAGVPAGVFNVVTGHASRVGGRMLSSPLIRKISFTGSTEVGKMIMKAAADGMKRVSLELGGNAPFLVFADADLDRAVAGALVAKFRAVGQTCVAANRFLVEATAADAFTDKLAAAVRGMAVGDGRDAGVQIGPLIDRGAVARVRRMVADAVERGARLVAGEVPAEGARFMKPVILTGVTSAMQVWREEIFGPVIAIRTFTGDAEAIALANDTDAGLVAYVYSEHRRRLVHLVEALEVGMVGVNEGLVSTAQAPFGGIKASGVGREGSRHGIDDYTNLKYVMTSV
jgi:succinate-semialdehyde dehydrogenase/glutarate-semialdehyde dehydrogenase